MQTCRWAGRQAHGRADKKEMPTIWLSPCLQACAHLSPTRLSDILSSSITCHPLSLSDLSMRGENYHAPTTVRPHTLLSALALWFTLLLLRGHYPKHSHIFVIELACPLVLVCLCEAICMASHELIGLKDDSASSLRSREVGCALGLQREDSTWHV